MMLVTIADNLEEVKLFEFGVHLSSYIFLTYLKSAIKLNIFSYIDISKSL